MSERRDDGRKNNKTVASNSKIGAVNRPSERNFGPSLSECRILRLQQVNESTQVVC